MSEFHRPIQFSIPKCKIIKEIPTKTRDFAKYIPGEAYAYDNEVDYYQGYQESLFAVTKKKAGWDCMRHYEILANGCIPYFIDLDKCPKGAMFRFPKELVLEAMHLPGVSYLKINHSVFDEKKYYEILNKLLEYSRNELTCSAIAKYVLEEMKYQPGQRILFLSENLNPDYMRCLTLIGLKQVLGDKVIDYPKVPHIYNNYPCDVKKLYGKGMSYTKIIEDLEIDRTDIANRINEFDYVIYGSVHRGLPFINLCIGKDTTYYICGEDVHHRTCKAYDNLFLRE